MRWLAVVVLSILLLGIDLWAFTLPPPKAEVHYIYIRPLTQWSCTPNEKQWYLGACAHRKWSEEHIKETRNGH